MKVYLERNYLQVESICDTVKNVDFIHVYFFEAPNSMQFHPPCGHLKVLPQIYNGRSIVTFHHGIAYPVAARIPNFVKLQCCLHILHYWLIYAITV